mgnify:CR=1 FL=1
MINFLFSAKMNHQEKLYKCFISLPASVKLFIIRYSCQIFKTQINRLKTPVKLIFYVTNKCNLKCGHCFYSKYLNKDADKELTLGEIKLIISSLRHKLLSLILTGGEPFLRHDLVDICEIVSKLNKTQMVTIDTNGFFPELTEETIKKILQKVSFSVNIQFSIDGLEETHDKIRGLKDSFRRAVDTINRCKRLKESFTNLNFLSILTTVSNKNYNEIEQLAYFIKFNLGVFHKFRLIRDSQNSLNSIDNDILSNLRPEDSSYCLPDTFQLNRLNDFLAYFFETRVDSLLSKFQIFYMKYCLDIIKKHKKVLDCLAGKFDGVIFPSGDVALCEMTTPFGNLRDVAFDFFKLWNSKTANQRKAKIKDCFCIHPCNILTSMSLDKNTIISLSRNKFKIIQRR